MEDWRMQCVCVFNPYMTIHSENSFSSPPLSFICVYFFSLLSYLQVRSAPPYCTSYLHSQSGWSPASPTIVQHVALTETSYVLCSGPVLSRLSQVWAQFVFSTTRMLASVSHVTQVVFRTTPYHRSPDNQPTESHHFSPYMLQICNFYNVQSSMCAASLTWWTATLCRGEPTFL